MARRPVYQKTTKSVSVSTGSRFYPDSTAEERQAAAEFLDDLADRASLDGLVSNATEYAKEVLRHHCINVSNWQNFVERDDVDPDLQSAARVLFYAKYLASHRANDDLDNAAWAAFHLGSTFERLRTIRWDLGQDKTPAARKAKGIKIRGREHAFRAYVDRYGAPPKQKAPGQGNPERTAWLEAFNQSIPDPISPATLARLECKLAQTRL